MIKNSIILNDVYLGDNTYVENCIVESRDTIRANTTYIGTPDNIRIVLEKNERYVLWQSRQDTIPEKEHLSEPLQQQMRRWPHGTIER